MISMRLLIWIKGQLVGEDDFGNRYYEERFLFSKPNRPPRRWVWYKDRADGSCVPAMWHGWLHFTHEGPLTTSPHSWQKSHQGNRTGTKDAYHPEGSLYQTEIKTPGPAYKAWSPVLTNEKNKDET